MYQSRTLLLVIRARDLWCSGRLTNFGGVPFTDSVTEHAKTHEEVKGTLLTLQKYVDQLYLEGEEEA
jgi:hypothetical protein